MTNIVNKAILMVDLLNWSELYPDVDMDICSQVVKVLSEKNLLAYDTTRKTISYYAHDYGIASRLNNDEYNVIYLMMATVIAASEVSKA